MTEKLTQLDSPLLAHIHKDATGLYNGITGNKEWATEIPVSYTHLRAHET